MTVIDHSMFNLQAALARAKEGILSKNRESEFTKVAYLPPGIHKIRFLHDPEGSLFRYVMLHTIDKKRTHCPNYLKSQDSSLKDLPECEICKLAGAVDDWKLGLSARYHAMIYGYLKDTSAPSDYWQPGNLYCIIGKPKLRDSVLSFLEGMLPDALDYVTAMLTPTINGGLCNVNVVGGTQGSIAISAIPGVGTSAIALDDKYQPLSKVWIPEDFDEASYMEVLALAKNVADEALSKKVAA